MSTFIVEIWHKLVLAEVAYCLHTLFLGTPWGYSWGREARRHVYMLCSCPGCCALTHPAVFLDRSPQPLALWGLLWGSIRFRLCAHYSFWLSVHSLYQQVLRVQNTPRGMQKEVGHGSPPPREGPAARPVGWSTWLDCGRFGAPHPLGKIKVPGRRAPPSTALGSNA